ncbi:acetyltransferase, ribosomal protein N-acetylase [Rheinheimera sp. A13L]|uniref:GNAT family N-acetyltransferase n=1 Tax=Rheinheimera sp. A13L TaxID=506534 RepID=UPI00021254E2|nr:GNAT family N-acetyltransferase [Rheinheimera sp. A13L]EGM77795.1 acetyltransferase, ribosomal protein N-acetylase [Rheinheimera sp. A13L]
MKPLDAGSLTLRLLTEADWPLFLQLHRHEQVLQYVADPLANEQIRQRFEERLQPWQAGDLHWFCLVVVEKKSGTAVGVCGFHGLDVAPDTGVIAEVGYLFLPEFFGKGYATVALKAALDYGTTLGIKQWQAVVTEGNIASGRVLEKCGFSLVDRQHNGYQIGDTFFADLIYKKLPVEPAL